MPYSNHIMDFNIISIRPLGTLPHLPITLGGKTICTNYIVVQGPLDFNMLVGHDYVYVMKVVVSLVF